MSKQLSELQTVLTQLTAEHRNLLSLMEAQHAAMMKFDLKSLTDLVTRQEASRLQINALDFRRKTLTRQIAVAAKVAGEPTLRQLALYFPQYSVALTQHRVELRRLIEQISRRGYISSKLAASVLGHVTTAMRLLASAVERAGLYTRQGVPRLASRIGVMEAVG
jgi:hypothetical protein